MLGWQNTYKSMPSMKTTVAAPEEPPNLGGESKICLEELFPIDLIRVHTKTDDVPTVTDKQLELYRSASIESAEQYTGLLLGGSRSISEEVNLLLTQRAFIKGFINYTTEYPIMDGIAYLYGYGDSRIIKVPPRSRKVRIPIIGASLDFSSACCRGPCGKDTGAGLSSNVYILYSTGFKNCNEIPAGIVLGCLKYIAWCVTHPGDEIIAVRNRTITRSSLVDGTNNVAWASGAIEVWRQYDPEAI